MALREDRAGRALWRVSDRELQQSSLPHPLALGLAALLAAVETMA
jgi:hypothetical protein